MENWPLFQDYYIRKLTSKYLPFFSFKTLVAPPISVLGQSLNNSTLKFKSVPFSAPSAYHALIIGLFCCLTRAVLNSMTIVSWNGNKLPIFCLFQSLLISPGPTLSAFLLAWGNRKSIIVAKSMEPDNLDLNPSFAFYLCFLEQVT